MKTTEFLNKTLKESFDPAEYRDEVGMVKNNLHTLVRAATDLGKCLKDNEDLPEWVQEKIANAKGMMVAASEYLQSQHTMGHQPEVPSFNAEIAEQQFNESVLGGAKQGGPTNAAEYKRMLGDVYDLMSQDKDPANRDIYNQKIADLKRVAKERGIALNEEATGGSTGASSIGAVVTELGGTTKDLIKRQKAYTNQQTAGGKVKVKNK
jgi:hypothetical protein